MHLDYPASQYVVLLRCTLLPGSCRIFLTQLSWGFHSTIMAASAAEVSGTYRFAVLYFLVAVPLPFCYVLWLVATNRVTDLHLSERRQRLAPFAISLFLRTLCGLGLLHAMAAPTILVVALSAAFVQTALLFVITWWWKISIHTAAITGLVTLAIMVLGSTALGLYAFGPALVAWARVYSSSPHAFADRSGWCSQIFDVRHDVWHPRGSFGDYGRGLAIKGRRDRRVVRAVGVGVRPVSSRRLHLGVKLFLLHSWRGVDWGLTRRYELSHRRDRLAIRYRVRRQR